MDFKFPVVTLLASQSALKSPALSERMRTSCPSDSPRSMVIRSVHALLDEY